MVASGRRKANDEFRRGQTIALWFETLRPRQWVKNLFVFLPLVFAKYLDESGRVLDAFLAFVSFSAASGAVYVLNDLRDLEADRRHPTKKQRPLASGRLAQRDAKWLLGGVVILALGLGLLVDVLSGGRFFTLVVLGYLLLNVAYSGGLKRVAYVDVACIAAGFLLRVSGGAMAVSVHPTGWLLTSTALLAGYLGLGKRAHELKLLGDRAAEHRPVLAQYRPLHVSWAMAVLGSITVVGYIVYTTTAHTRAFFRTDRLVWTVPFAAYGLFRFWQLVVDDRRQDSPTDAMLRDAPFLVNIVLWGLSIVVVIYGFSR
ncbi:MAG: decaprenyl-phosphate phosphoribosyltransferase [Deltaproteobacteria bacterium]|nr:decaprenyl-phosphate phosphoribosyltransferase [Deltaproteobacteria bacterium]